MIIFMRRRRKRRRFRKRFDWAVGSKRTLFFWKWRRCGELFFVNKCGRCSAVHGGAHTFEIKTR